MGGGGDGEVGVGVPESDHKGSMPLGHGKWSDKYGHMMDKIRCGIIPSFKMADDFSGQEQPYN